jgi:hypothetical protein
MRCTRYCLSDLSCTISRHLLAASLDCRYRQMCRSRVPSRKLSQAQSKTPVLAIAIVQSPIHQLSYHSICLWDGLYCCPALHHPSRHAATCTSKWIRTFARVSSSIFCRSAISASFCTFCGSRSALALGRRTRGMQNAVRGRQYIIILNNNTQLPISSSYTHGEEACCSIESQESERERELNSAGGCMFSQGTRIFTSKYSPLDIFPALEPRDHGLGCPLPAPATPQFSTTESRGEGLLVSAAFVNSMTITIGWSRVLIDLIDLIDLDPKDKTNPNSISQIIATHPIRRTVRRPLSLTSLRTWLLL